MIGSRAHEHALRLVQNQRKSITRATDKPLLTRKALQEEGGALWKLSVALEAFRPDLVMISSGLDGRRGHSCGLGDLIAEDYEWFTREVRVHLLLLVYCCSQLCRGRAEYRAVFFFSCLFLFFSFSSSFFFFSSFLFFFFFFFFFDYFAFLFSSFPFSLSTFFYVLFFVLFSFPLDVFRLSSFLHFFFSRVPFLVLVQCYRNLIGEDTMYDGLILQTTGTAKLS